MASSEPASLDLLLLIANRSLSLFAFHALLTASAASRSMCMTPAVLSNMQHALIVHSTDVLVVEEIDYEERIASLRYAGVLFHTLFSRGHLPCAGQHFIVSALATLRQWATVPPAQMPTGHLSNLKRLLFQDLAFAKGKPAPPTPDVVQREQERQLNTLRFYAESLQIDTTGVNMTHQLLALPQLRGVKLHANPHVESAGEASSRRLHAATWGRTDKNDPNCMFCACVLIRSLGGSCRLPPRSCVPMLSPAPPCCLVQGSRARHAPQARSSRSSPRSLPRRATFSPQRRRVGCLATACVRSRSVTTSSLDGRTRGTGTRRRRCCSRPARGRPPSTGRSTASKAVTSLF